MTGKPPDYLRQYEELAYGLFLHWGLYSQLESGEWVRHYRNISKEEYEKLAESFTASAFDAGGLVRWARGAGFRYLCLTTRHHDGFSLYDTRGLNNFDAPHSAARRDLVAEYAAACHAEGMAMFFYHTTLDWLAPSFEEDFPAYLDYLRRSVEVLCTQYGKVSGLWFDGNWARPDVDWEEDQLYGMIRRHQPECVIVNNSGTKARGAIGHPEVDVVTFEQGAPASVAVPGRYLASEMCETINSHWGIAADDYSMKSPARIIDTLAACRRAGANLLLNIAPRADGSLPAYEKSALDIVGRWIDRCGGSIYRGRPAGFACTGKDFVLAANGSLYYFAHHLPIQGNAHLHEQSVYTASRMVRGALPAIGAIHWVDNEERLVFAQDMAKGELTFEATDYPYGSQMEIRVARLTPR
jgi:alpha-L-fucosidase